MLVRWFQLEPVPGGVATQGKLLLGWALWAAKGKVPPRDVTVGTFGVVAFLRLGGRG